ncbi:hypothetical protein [Aeromonas jandaei]|uniref:hypothetical protein n=1 Tax=Aeromonas jandaei TaxID=650 RepID=UPI00111727AD|nr:hypothetical protein [Aeromonas jandaei]TNI05913.1 hypothetical protein CF104_05790 [Aeromonas jandaei]
MDKALLSIIINDGNQILKLLNQGHLDLADTELDNYLNSLEFIFSEVETDTKLNIEERQVLEQFKQIVDWVEQQKSSVEIELLQFSKAGKATKRYKSNAG